MVFRASSGPHLPLFPGERSSLLDIAPRVIDKIPTCKYYYSKPGLAVPVRKQRNKITSAFPSYRFRVVRTPSHCTFLYRPPVENPSTRPHRRGNPENRDLHILISVAHLLPYSSQFWWHAKIKLFVSLARYPRFCFLTFFFSLPFWLGEDPFIAAQTFGKTPPFLPLPHHQRHSTTRERKKLLHRLSRNSFSILPTERPTVYSFTFNHCQNYPKVFFLRPGLNFSLCKSRRTPWVRLFQNR